MTKTSHIALRNQNVVDILLAIMVKIDLLRSITIKLYYFNGTVIFYSFIAFETYVSRFFYRIVGCLCGEGAIFCEAFPSGFAKTYSLVIIGVYPAKNSMEMKRVLCIANESFRKTKTDGIILKAFLDSRL